MEEETGVKSNIKEPEPEKPELPVPDDSPASLIPKIEIDISETLASIYHDK